MKFEISGSKIKIGAIEQFNPQHIFECGQVFAYKKFNDVFVCYPQNKIAVVYKNDNGYVIECFIKENVDFFITYFDLNTDYKKIKEEILTFINKKEVIFDVTLIKKAIQFGGGIRILRQDLLEMIISFIISANNNIKRIIRSLDLLRAKCGNEIKVDWSKISNLKECDEIKEQKFYSFPCLQILEMLSESFFEGIGSGYRAPYLVDTIQKLNIFFKDEISQMDTNELRNKFIALKGVGRKVSDCILLFGCARKDVFPVDTWIKQVYFDLNIKKINDEQNKLGAEKISTILAAFFGKNAGYIQQYLFYFKRELKGDINL